MDPNQRRLPISGDRKILRNTTPRCIGSSAENTGGSVLCTWARSSSQDTPPIDPGTLIGDFEVVREIGRQGIGMVLEARQLSRNRRVALKVLRPDLSECKEAAVRFREEAALASRVVHPGIIPVLSAGAAGGYEYYVMTYICGPTLQEFMAGACGSRGDLFFRETALRFADLARAVDALHRAGILHRNINPSNLFFEGDRFILGDFEVAVDLSTASLMEGNTEKPEERLQDQGLGRPPVYSAPEEFVRGYKLDPRSDVYSLGMVLYELVTGVLPFPHCAADCMARLKLTRRPLAPRRMNPEIPLGLEAVIRQAIDVNLLIRHSSAGELACDLDRFASRKRGLTRRHDPPGIIPKDPNDPEDSKDSSDGDDSPDLVRIQ